MIKEAMYYEQIGSDRVQCHLCPAECLLKDGQQGICVNRYNKNGKLYTDNYAEVVTIAVDPIEKKPLYHFYPGTDILSTGPNGCNFKCLNCQNWTISQEKVKTINIQPEKLAELAREHNTIGVAFTYTEPLIWFEYILDAARHLKEQNLKVVLVSNGYINPKPFAEILPLVDAFNIDIKSMSPDFYIKICKGKLQPVLDTIKTIADSESYLELTNLLIPQENDSTEEIMELIEFVASISEDIPLHFSAYHPDYKMDREATPPEKLIEAFELAQKRLNYVYIGNMLTEKGKDTICPKCSHILIKRRYFEVIDINPGLPICTNCGFQANIIQ